VNTGTLVALAVVALAPGSIAGWLYRRFLW
jgi:hypothetical protein